MQPTKFMFFVPREQGERALSRGLEASHQNQPLLWKWLEGRDLILASLMHRTHILILKVRKKEIARRIGPVFFLLPRITSKAPPESLQFVHLLMHSFTLPSNKYSIVPTSCQALPYGPEIQGEQGKQHQHAGVLFLRGIISGRGRSSLEDICLSCCWFCLMKILISWSKNLSESQ